MTDPVISGKKTGGHNEQAGRNVTNEIREQRKLLIGTRQDRKRKKHSESFNTIFKFFLDSYRKGILLFCGEDVRVKFDKDGDDGKITIKKFENGEFKGSNVEKLKSRHSNIVRGVIIGKKSWGLWVDQWTDGIVDGSFRRKEILDEFEKLKIKIPEPFLIDFDNTIYNKTMKRMKKETDGL